MNGNTDPKLQPIRWLKGHPRPEAEASACIHLGFHLELPARAVAEKAAIATASGEQAQRIVPQLTGMPRLWLLCRSPELHNAIYATVHPALRKDVQGTLVALEICRLCPFFRKVQ